MKLRDQLTEARAVLDASPWFQGRKTPDCKGQCIVTAALHVAQHNSQVRLRDMTLALAAELPEDFPRISLSEMGNLVHFNDSRETKQEALALFDAAIEHAAS